MANETKGAQAGLPRAESISLDHLIETATSAALRAFQQQPTTTVPKTHPWIWVGIIASPAGSLGFPGGVAGPGGGISQQE
jgi:hypothetical protein